MMGRSLVVLVVLLFASCSGGGKQPCVNCGPDNGVDQPDMGGGGDSGSADMPTTADVAVGDVGSGGEDASDPDTGNAGDMGVDGGGDVGMDADVGVTCLAEELLCGGVCATCPADVNVATYACAAAECVIATCDVGYETCSGGCCLPAGPAPSGPVSTQSFSALDTSIALDKDGYPQISYRNFFNTNIEHARWDGRAWVITVVETGVQPEKPALAIDALDRPHVAWLESDPFDLKYAVRTGAGWQVETVDAGGDVGNYASLAIDSMNRPHIAYQDATNATLKYARHDGTAWVIETVDAGGGNTGWFSTLALDSNGRPHIAYSDFSLFAVRYARWNGATWQIESVETRPSIPQYVTMDLDSMDRAHIAYLDNPVVDLRYVRWNGTAWVGQTVDALANFGSSSTIKVDGSDYPHIVYADATTDKARVARFDGAAWMIQDISPLENIGPSSSIAVDSAGGEHISLSIKGPGPVELRYLNL